jgi:hypothetical protein
MLIVAVNVVLGAVTVVVAGVAVSVTVPVHAAEACEVEAPKNASAANIASNHRKPARPGATIL